MLQCLKDEIPGAWMSLINPFFCHEATCSLVSIYTNFGPSPSGWVISTSSTVKMEAICSCDTLENAHCTTRHHIASDGISQSAPSESLSTRLHGVTSRQTAFLSQLRENHNSHLATLELKAINTSALLPTATLSTSVIKQTSRTG